MGTQEEVDQLVAAQVDAIADPACRAALRLFLIRPQLQIRFWDYGGPTDRHPVWLIARLTGPDPTFALAYCEHGFGPSNPWGVLSTDDLQIGRDDSWFLSLEDAFRNSPAWVGRNPPNYEVP